MIKRKMISFNNKFKLKKLKNQVERKKHKIDA